MTKQTYRPSHQELIAVHRHRYQMHALAALKGLKEFKFRDDCGVTDVRLDLAFINGIEGRMHGRVDRADLCDRIVKGLPVGALDCVLSAYVARLTGKAA